MGFQNLAKCLYKWHRLKGKQLYEVLLVMLSGVSPATDIAR